MHEDKAEAGVPLTKTFHDHLLGIMQSDARNPEVQNRFAAARKAGMPGPAISFSGNEANPLFRNTGRGFVEIGTTLGISRIEDGRGFVLVDLDGDGAQDVVLHNFYRNPIVALLNRAAGDNRWIRFHLRGKKSNRFGVGAQVKVKTAERQQLQELHCGSGYQSCQAPELHFGLGKSEKADVSVRWPSGLTEVYESLDANRVYTFVEGEPDAVRARELRRISVDPDPPEPEAPEPDVRAILKGLRTLQGDPAPVDGSAIAILFSIDCHACLNELRRLAEIEDRAKSLGVRTVWVSIDTDAKRVEDDFRRNGAPLLPLRPTEAIGPIPTPSVYRVTETGVEKFTGRFAVTASLEAASRPTK